MSWPTSFFYPHRVAVRDFEEGAGDGPGHGAPRELIAEVKDEQRLVRTADGSEAVSSSTVTVPIDSNVAPGSLVIVWAGTSSEREATVMAVARDENPRPLPSHLILALK